MAWEDLRDLVDDASAALPAVERKRMFGCDAWWAAGKIYALVWDGRIGLKLPDPAEYATVMAMEGASAWSPGRSKMSAWVLVPEAFNDDGDALRAWVGKAHGAALCAVPKAPRKRATRKKRG